MRLLPIILMLAAAPALAQTSQTRGPMTRTADLPPPPRAEQRPHSFERHGVRIEDPYNWLRDPSYPKVDDADVLAYLKAENAYFEAAMKPHQPLIETLFQEMRGRIKEDDASVPVKDGHYEYWWAFKPGAQYRTWYRRPLDARADRTGQVIFDEVKEAEGKEYFRLGAMQVSHDGRYAAILLDDDGSERFQLKIRDLATGQDIETVTEVGIGQPVWTADSRGVVYTEVNENWRSYRARFHRRQDAVRGKGECRLHRRCRPVPGPQVHLDQHRREQLQRDPFYPRGQSGCSAGADRRAPPQHPVQRRCRARDILDPH
jgi:oligopeptidase B